MPSSASTWGERGEPASVAGWGHTSHGGSASHLLRSVSVDMIGKEQCRAAYGKSAITDQMICAGTSEGGKDACQVGRAKLRYHLLGIFAYLDHLIYLIYLDTI